LQLPYSDGTRLMCVLVILPLYYYHLFLLPCGFHRLNHIYRITLGAYSFRSNSDLRANGDIGGLLICTAWTMESPPLLQIWTCPSILGWTWSGIVSTCHVTLPTCQMTTKSDEPDVDIVPKKRKLSFSNVSANATDNTVTPHLPAQSAKYWFEDGNFLLQAGNTLFKVHQSVLASQCTFFRNAFEKYHESESPVSTSTSSNLNPPMMTLPSSVEDMELLLAFMYDGLRYPLFRGWSEQKYNCLVQHLEALFRSLRRWQIPCFPRIRYVTNGQKLWLYRTLEWRHQTPHRVSSRLWERGPSSRPSLAFTTPSPWNEWYIRGYHRSWPWTFFAVCSYLCLLGNSELLLSGKFDIGFRGKCKYLLLRSGEDRSYVHNSAPDPKGQTPSKRTCDYSSWTRTDSLMDYSVHVFPHARKEDSLQQVMQITHKMRHDSERLYIPNARNLRHVSRSEIRVVFEPALSGWWCGG